jgi:hypothetical protein
MMCRGLEHPEIEWMERTGYPSWMQEKEEPEYDEDALYDESRERELFD